MPFKDPEDKRRWTKMWHQRGREDGYNDWLYARRKLRFDDADKFREALEQIANGIYPISGGPYPTPASIAIAALDESKSRHDEVGPSPRANGEEPVAPVAPTEARQGDSLVEALAKLGLN